MKFHIKAALLSALVFPGLGQIYKGERGKGVALIAAVSLLLLVTLALLLLQIVPLLLASPESGLADPARVLERLHSGTPTVRLLIGSLGGLWLYSWIDAAVGRKRTE